MAGEKATRGGIVYARIREDIFDGVFQPGQRLRLVELAQRFSVSQSVVREALTRLSEQGLVRAAPQQGFRVVALSLDDLDELTEARVDIETLVLRRAIERGDLKWEAAVVAAHHHLAGVTGARPDGSADPEWFTVHEQFHHALLKGCGNARLLAVAVGLRDASTLYRRWALPVAHDTERDVAGEHQRIVDAVLRRDADAAVALLAHHLDRTAQALRSVIGADAADAAGSTGPADPAATVALGPSRRPDRAAGPGRYEGKDGTMIPRHEAGPAGRHDAGPAGRREAGSSGGHDDGPSGRNGSRADGSPVSGPAADDASVRSHPPTAGAPSGWIRRLAPDPAAVPEAPASLPDTVARATEELGPRPVAWAVAAGAELARVIIREVPELGGGPVPFETLRMGTEAATLHALMLLAGATDDRAAPEESLLGDREFARRRLGLDKVLRGIRVAHAALTGALMAACQDLVPPAERAEQFRRLSQLLFEFIDEFSSRMTAEYLAEHDRWLTGGAAAREELVRAVLDGRPVREDSASELLGYRLGGHHLAVIAWCDSPAAEAVGDLQRAASELLHRRGCASTLVVPVGRTTVWAWGDPRTGAAPERADTRPGPGSPAPGEARGAAPGHARRDSRTGTTAPAPGASPYPQDIRFACGAVRHGTAGFRQSHEDARHTERVMRLNPHGTGPVVDHPDVELAALLCADLPALRRFVGDELGALAADSPHAEQLRRTLHLYLRNERSLTVAAAQLHVARNTVTYRVKRAQELLGHDLTPRLPEVMTALEAVRTLGAAVLRPEGDGVHDDPVREG